MRRERCAGSTKGPAAIDERDRDFYRQQDLASEYRRQDQEYDRAKRQRDTEQGYCWRGRAQQALDKSGAALADYQKAIDIDRNYAPAHYDKGWIAQTPPLP